MIKFSVNYTQFNRIDVPDANHFRTAIRKGLFLAGKNIVKYAKTEILDKSKKTGRLYYIPTITKSGKTRVKKHRASAEGQYPANLTGRLRREFEFLVVGADKLIVGDKAPYAKKLEKNLNRKLTKAAVEDNAKHTIDFIRQEIDKYVKKL